MSGTIAFDIKDKLVAACKADSTISTIDPTVDITYGFEGRVEELPRLCIQVGEVMWDTEHDVALGGLKRDEEFYIVLAIHSHVPGDTQPDANGRVKTIGHAIEAIVRDPRWTGVANVILSGFVPQYLAEGSDAEGRGAIFLARVYVTARI